MPGFKLKKLTTQKGYWTGKGNSHKGLSSLVEGLRKVILAQWEGFR
jgi:hypothetical protein